jgi:DNA-cytosine methyltransferase
MNVLSLFDGMSCGRIALDRLGIPVDKYYASEIDKFAIQVSEANYPDIIRLGDVCDVKAEDLEPIDLLIAGSPCQGFSFAGHQLAFDDPRSALFFEFVRLLKECKPKYFLLENVRMKKEFLDIISEQVGCEPIFINSALVSAQSRQRYYWTNIPSIEQPEQRGIVLRDILESEVGDEFKYSKKAIEYMERGNDKWQQAGKRRADRYEQTADKDKSFAITANWHKGVPYNYFKEQTHDTPKQVGTASDIKGHDILKRVYSPEGKSPTLTTMGGGNREPKVVTGGALRARSKKDGKQVEWKETKPKQMLELRKDKKSNAISTVSKDSLVVEDEVHWRKLTPIECERLQTVPDNYTDCVSNTQRYKMLGNGWTIEVIAHIFKNMQLLEEGKELPASKGQLELGMD